MKALTTWSGSQDDLAGTASFSVAGRVLAVRLQSFKDAQEIGELIELAEKLAARGFSAAAINGDVEQKTRERTIQRLKDGQIDVLVATDIAARGIDIDQLPHVVNFELPNVPEDYVHRIGRTGRAGASGEAISLVCLDEEGFLHDIEKLVRHPIARRVIAGFEPAAGERAEPIVLGRRMTLGGGGGTGRGGARRDARHRAGDKAAPAPRRDAVAAQAGGDARSRPGPGTGRGDGRTQGGPAKGRGGPDRRGPGASGPARSR